MSALPNLPLSGVDPAVLASAVKRLNRIALTECFDPSDLTSRPTDSQLEVLKDIGRISHRYALGGNQSGKSQTGRRECAWVFTETHPYWSRPADWGKEPLLLLMIGKIRRQVEDSLWAGVKQFLEPGTYKEVRVGPHIEKIVHKNGNTLILLSHDNPAVAVERIQSYTAHWAWLDEMPTSYRVLEEIHRRCQVKAAPFLATFTPKTVNPQIKKLVDSSKEPFAKKYTLKAFDNPKYDQERKAAILESLKSYSEAYQKTILEGDWAVGTNNVFHFDPEFMVQDPPGYSPGWRHCESSDPALKSSHGLTVWAENPATGVWYCIRDDYLEGMFTPADAVAEVKTRTAGLNIVRRMSDTAPWYVNTAYTEGLKYLCPHDKATRKIELIKNLQTAFSEGRLKIASWCSSIVEELNAAQWKEDSAHLVAGQKYHLLDSAQYFNDLKPPYEASFSPKTWEQSLYEANEKRKKQEAAIRKGQLNKMRLQRARRTRW